MDSNKDTSKSKLFRKIRWNDTGAGLSLAGLLLPQALAYSSIANMPPQAGIFALFAGLLCYGLLGSSRFAIVSATSSSALVLATATASFGYTDTNMRLMLAMGLVITTGIIFIVASIFRMGKITDFIAKPVLRGFTFGLAIIIILQQCTGVVGIESLHGSTLEILKYLFSTTKDWNLPSILIASLSLLLLFLFERVRSIPGGIVVVLLGIAAGKWLHLDNYGVHLFGSVQLDILQPVMPNIDSNEWLHLCQLSFALLFVLYAESYSSIRSFAMKHNQHISPNKDLLALGIANIASGLLRGMPVGAGYSATAANEKNGATSQWAGICAAAVILLIVLSAMPYIALIPKPVLAAIVIHAVSHTLISTVFRTYFEWHRGRLVIVASVIAVLTFGVLDGLVISVGISIFLMLRQMAASTVSQMGRHGRRDHDFVNMAVFPQATHIPNILILRPDQALFFANADRTFAEIRENRESFDAPVHSIIISLEQTPDLDGTTIEALRNFASAMDERGEQLILARVKNAAYEVLMRSLTPDFPQVVISRLSVSHAVTVAEMAQSEKDHHYEEDALL